MLEQQQVWKLVLADDFMLLPMRSQREQHRDRGQRQEQTADPSQLPALVGPSQQPGHRANAGYERRHETGEYSPLARSAPESACTSASNHCRRPFGDR